MNRENISVVSESKLQTQEFWFMVYKFTFLNINWTNMIHTWKNIKVVNKWPFASYI